MKNTVAWSFSLALFGLASCSFPIQKTDLSTVKSFTQVQPTGADLPDKTLSLTFDDGPGERTVELAEYLSAQGIKATWFVLGNAAQGNESVLRKLKSLGHLVASHSYSHPHMPQVSNPVEEISLTDEIIKPYISGNIFLFRAPYADWNSTLSTQLNQAGFGRYVGSIYWNVDGGDWNCWAQKETFVTCGQKYLENARLRKKGPVLLHDSTLSNATVDMVKWLVPRLKNEGFKFVRLDAIPSIAQLIKSSGGTPGTTDTQVRIGQIECPAGYTLTSLGTAGGKYCVNGVNVWGPFTNVMKAKCREWGGDSACDTDRWDISMALPARGTGLCPAGASYDMATSYCTEGANAFGPFPSALVNKCLANSGGETECRSARWDRNFLLGLMN